MQVVIGKTDCLLERGFCSAEKVTGYPGLKFYSHGLGVERAEGAVYSGDRDMASLETFLRSHRMIKWLDNMTWMTGMLWVSRPRMQGRRIMWRMEVT